MSEQVQCSECADVYDSDEHPFCPRCGALATAATPQAAVKLAGRSDPRRRRVQAAGAMMISTGGLLCIIGLVAISFAGTMASDMFDAGLPQESSPVLVTVESAGEPVEGALVRLQPIGGNVTELATDANGTAWFPVQGNALVDVHVSWSDGNYSARLVAVALGSGSDMPLVIDTQNGEPTAPVLDEGVARQSVRVLGVVSLAMGLVPLAGGIAAIRLRQRTLAISGVVVGGIPWALFMVASLNLLVLMVLAMYIAAFVFLRKGRTLFTS